MASEAQLVRAEQLLAAGRPSDEIHDALDSAAALFAKTDHANGAIDVQRVTARLAIEREMANPDALEACLEAYRRIDFFRVGFIDSSVTFTTTDVPD